MIWSQEARACDDDRQLHHVQQACQALYKQLPMAIADCRVVRDNCTVSSSRCSHWPAVPGRTKLAVCRPHILSNSNKCEPDIIPERKIMKGNAATGNAKDRHYRISLLLFNPLLSKPPNPRTPQHVIFSCSSALVSLQLPDEIGTQRCALETI